MHCTSRSSSAITGIGNSASNSCSNTGTSIRTGILVSIISAITRAFNNKALAGVCQVVQLTMRALKRFAVSAAHRGHCINTQHGHNAERSAALDRVWWRSVDIDNVNDSTSHTVLPLVNLRRTAVAFRVRYTGRHAEETTRGPICASQGQAEAQEEQRRVPMPETAMQDLPRVHASRVCAGLHVSVHSCAHASTH